MRSNANSRVSPGASLRARTADRTRSLRRSSLTFRRNESRTARIKDLTYLGVLRGCPDGNGKADTYAQNSLCNVMESFICKVTAAGRFTLPKEIRKALRLKGGEYVVVALLGKAAVVRPLRAEDDLLAAIRTKVKKSGLTDAGLRKLVDEAGREAWRRRRRSTDSRQVLSQ